MMRSAVKTILLWLLLAVSLIPATPAEAFFRNGHIVQIEQLAFHPDTATVPGDAFSVLVIQNREAAPIDHEVLSDDLFEAGTLLSVLGTGTVEYAGKRVSRVVLRPGEEVVIWYYAAKGRTYTYQCNLNGHAMQGSVQAT